MDSIRALEETHSQALTCFRHVLSFKRTAAEVDHKLYVDFDADQLRKALKDGRASIRPIVWMLNRQDIGGTVILSKGGYGVARCGVEAKCNHGLCFQLAAALVRKSKGKAQRANPFDVEELFGLYAAVGSEYERAKVAMVVTSAPEKDGQLSKSDGPKQWARLFGFSVDTLMRRFKDGKIRHKKYSAKSYAIHVDDLPKAPMSASSSRQ